MPATHFAPAARASVDEVREAIKHCSTHPMLGTILKTFGGVVAVLNAQRQILAVNTAALDMLGIEDAAEALGLRPGEAIDCSHADDLPGGCGTGEACASCGAAISIVACQREDVPQEAECTLTVVRKGARLDVQLRVRVSPLEIDGTRLLLLFLEDITAERRRATLERAFYHDVSNTMTGLQCAADRLSLSTEEERAKLQEQIRSYAERLAREIQVQRTLSSSQPTAPRVVPRSCSVSSLLAEVAQTAGHHQSSCGRTLALAPVVPADLRTDAVLATRVLLNMVLNALEASPAGGEVRFGADPSLDGVLFHVWNPGAIPRSIQPRIFQRYFTTKEGNGRGIGTFAMKLLGEDYLRGKVDFESSAEAGTTFRLWLPSLLPPTG